MRGGVRAGPQIRVHQEVDPAQASGESLEVHRAEPHLDDRLAIPPADVRPGIDPEEDPLSLPERRAEEFGEGRPFRFDPAAEIRRPARTELGEDRVMPFTDDGSDSLLFEEVVRDRAAGGRASGQDRAKNGKPNGAHALDSSPAAPRGSVRAPIQTGSRAGSRDGSCPPV